MRHDKLQQVAAGLKKRDRQYARRYGVGIMHCIAEHKKYPVAMLDHGRENAAIRAGLVRDRGRKFTLHALRERHATIFQRRDQINEFLADCEQFSQNMEALGFRLPAHV